MATGRDNITYQGIRARRKRGECQEGINPAGGIRKLTNAEIVAASRNIVIKPGMKLVWDDELNRMVWR